MGEANGHVRDRGRMHRESVGENLNLEDPLRADIYVLLDRKHHEVLRMYY